MMRRYNRSKKRFPVRVSFNYVGLNPPLLRKTVSFQEEIYSSNNYGFKVYQDKATINRFDNWHLPKYFIGEQLSYRQFIINKLKISLSNFSINIYITDDEKQAAVVSSNIIDGSSMRFIVKLAQDGAPALSLLPSHHDQTSSYKLRKSFFKSFTILPKCKNRITTSTLDATVKDGSIGDLLTAMGAEEHPNCFLMGVLMDGTEPAIGSTYGWSKVLTCNVKYELTYTLSEKWVDAGRLVDLRSSELFKQ